MAEAEATIKVRRALLSVADKTGLVEFARGLHERGVELWASGGTARALRAGGLPVRELSELTGFSELLGGRVKTLHPKIHAAILAKRDDPEQLRALEAHGVEPFDLIVVNLYPFEARVERGTPPAEAMEWVDVGGEALIRAAAKNFSAVGVVVDPHDYPIVLEELKAQGGLSPATALQLAGKAFAYAARYNAAIARWFAAQRQAQEQEGQGLPDPLVLAEPLALRLRYGENPHQPGALYGPPDVRPEPLQGKPLSFVNVLDADAALKCALEFERPTAVIVKHATPCGVASAGTLKEAFERAFEADARAAFGGIVGLNAALDAPTAAAIAAHFLEVVIAPDVEPEALEILKQRKNLRVLKAPAARFDRDLELRSTAFGLLAQPPSSRALKESDVEVVTKRAPTAQELKDLLFAWRVAKWVKSNGVVLAKDERTVGIGGGHVARVDAVEFALRKAGDRARGSVLASDAFFPFRDSVDLAARAGVTAVIQPGGSVRDSEVIEAADEHGLAMVLTRVREFRH